MLQFRFKAMIIGLGLAIALAACSDSKEDLGGNYLFIDEGQANKIIISKNSSDKAIYGKVVEYAYDDKFIVAKQRPDFNDHKSKLAFELRSDIEKYPNNSENDIITTKALADSILRNDNFYKRIFSRDINFWIIVIEEDTLIGPLSSSEYLDVRKRLNVPKKLTLLN